MTAPMPLPPAPAPPPVGQPSPRRVTHEQRLAVLLGLIIAMLAVIQLFSAILLPFVMACIIAYILDPLAAALERAGIGRATASLLLILGMLAAGLLFVLLLYPLIIAQLGLLIGRVPQYAAQLQTWAQEMLEHMQAQLGPDFGTERIRDLITSQASGILGFIRAALIQVIGGGFALFNVLSFAVVTPIVAFYILRDWPRIVERGNAWLPRRYASVIQAQAREIDRILSAWVRGQALCCVFLAIYYALALSFVGLDLGLTVGISTGLLSFIPYVGSTTGGLLSIGLALSQFPSWRGVIEVVGVLVVGQILEGYVIYPRFLGDRVELPAVWVFFALFAGGEAFGFLGVMLAVPVAAAIGVLCRFWLQRYLRSPLYLDPPSAP